MIRPTGSEASGILFEWDRKRKYQVPSSTALMSAAFFGRTDIAKELFDHSAEVDPALDNITITFDKKMNSGVSFTMDYKGTGLLQWDEEKKTVTILIKMEPNHEYSIVFNSNIAKYKGFASEVDIPVEPVVYTFKTK